MLVVGVFGLVSDIDGYVGSGGSGVRCSCVTALGDGVFGGVVGGVKGGVLYVVLWVVCWCCR